MAELAADISKKQGADQSTLLFWLSCLAGVAGAAAIAMGLSIDFVTGDTRFGRSQWLAVGAGGGLVLLGLMLRYIPRRDFAGLVHFGLLLAQISALFLVVQTFELELPAFHNFLFGIVVTGFLASFFLPAAWRSWFFLLLSLAVMPAILGISGAAWALLIVGGSMAVCHLPVSVWFRVAVLLGIAVILGLVRVGTLPVPSLQAVMPIIGSILMFRLIVYLYDLNTGKRIEKASVRFGYFFMLPNFVFPFFPVVDSNAWRRSFKAEPSLGDYQKGIMWIAIGVFHLLLYRFVNYRLAFDPSEVAGFASFLWYCITNFALYLKISGLFHLIIGCFFLFGYLMPETHKRYYLSNSFVELWRRINIYWKDFMQKTVFNPVFTYARHKKYSQDTAVILAIAAVFAATWFLHAYQWFWLLGTVLLTIPDILFWMLLGGFLIFQTSRQTKTSGPGWIEIPAVLHTALQTLCMMTCLVVLWSLWGSETLEEWFLLLGNAGFDLLNPTIEFSASAVLRSVAFLAFLFIIFAVACGFYFGVGASGRPKPAARKKPQVGANWALGVSVVILCAAALGSQWNGLASLLPKQAQIFAIEMGAARLSQRDQERLERGYYENLTDPKIINSELWAQGASGKPENITIEQTNAAINVTDIRDYVLRPNAVVGFKGAILSVNSLGLRDKEYTLEKPSGTLRIALVGDSRAMGTGVGDAETFENLLEDRLNALGSQPVEVLNFGVAGYDAFQKNMLVEKDVLRFDPDIILYVAHNTELKISPLLAEAFRSGDLAGTYLESAVEKVGVSPEQSLTAISEQFQRSAEPLVSVAYAQLADLSARIGAEVIWAFLPSTKPYAQRLSEGIWLSERAKENGFATVDMYDIYNDIPVPAEALWISPFDDHPNQMGHRIIADRLFTELEALGILPE